MIVVLFGFRGRPIALRPKSICGNTHTAIERRLRVLS